MNLDRKTREELNALSKEIFGVSSRWQRLLNGVPTTVTKEVEEHVPAEFETKANEDGTESQVVVKAATTRKVKVPVLKLDKNGRDGSNGKGYKTMKYYTIDEVRAQLLDMKAQLDAWKELQAAKIVEAAAAEALKKAEAHVRDAAHGSAL